MTPTPGGPALTIEAAHLGRAFERWWPDLRDRYGYGGFVQLDHHGPGCARMVIDGKSFREIEASCWDPKTRLADCARHAVDVQVLSTVPVMFSYWAKPRDTLDLARVLNDHVAEANAAPPAISASLLLSLRPLAHHAHDRGQARGR